VYIRKIGDLPAKFTVYTPYIYIYGPGQLYIYGIVGREIAKYTVYIYGSGQPYTHAPVTRSFEVWSECMCVCVCVCHM